MNKKISIVVPAHNEEDNVPLLHKAIKEVFMHMDSYSYELIFVDDGSTDTTYQVLTDLALMDSKVFYIKLSRNFGHQYALKAGVDYATGDAVINMDCDLQHPIELIPQLVEKWEQGYDVVSAIRKSTQGVGVFKKASSNTFYKFFNFFSQVPIKAGGADFRLMDRRVADVFSSLGENQLFVRGLIQWLGFRHTSLEFDAGSRVHGKSSYNIRRMFRLALDGITSFSSKPLEVAMYLGFFFSGVSVLFVPYILWSYIVGVTVTGWSSVLVSVVFFGGVQLIILGIIGIYIGKIFSEVKRRPQYVVEKTNCNLI